MSNFSSVYQVYLTGYAGVDEGAGMPTTERLCQALALGVYHRTTSKPPLMSSVAVTAELRTMSGVKAAPGPFGYPVASIQTAFDVVLVSVDPGRKIQAIKVIRDLVKLGLKESKDLVDAVQDLSAHKVLLSAVTKDRAEATAKLLREAGCVVEVS